jgi:hypothetical protein
LKLNAISLLSTPQKCGCKCWANFLDKKSTDMGWNYYNKNPRFCWYNYSKKHTNIAI